MHSKAREIAVFQSRDREGADVRKISATGGLSASANMIGAPLGGFVMAGGGGGTLWSGTLMLGIAAAILYATIFRHMSVKTAD